MLRYDSLLVTASWLVIVALILAGVLLGRALWQRDQRRAQAGQRYLPVEIFGKQVPRQKTLPT